MALADSSTPPTASRTGFSVLSKAANSDGDVSAQHLFTVVSPSPSPESYSKMIQCTTGYPMSCVPSSRPRNANSRSGGSGGVGGRRRYGTDPMRLHGVLQLGHAVSTAADVSSFSRTAPHGSDGGASSHEKDYIPYEEGAGAPPHSTTPLHAALRRAPSPAGAAAVARTGTSAASVLLRHSHGGKTRLLYADGHVETVVAGSATKPPAVRSHASSATRHRRWGAENKRSLPSASQLGATTREKAAAPPPPSTNQQWLLESFNAVAQVHQLPPLPLLESITTSQWSGVTSSPGHPAHATESNGTWPVETGSSRQETKLSWIPIAAVESQPPRRPPQQQQQQATMNVTFPLPSQEKPPQLPGDFSNSTSKVDCPRKPNAADGEGESSGRTAAHRTLACGPSASSTVASANRYGTSNENTLADTVSTVVAGAPLSASSVGEVACCRAVVDAETVIAEIQRSVRAELVTQKRVGAQTFASRYARDMSASPSLFSLRFPFRPLSELYAFVDRPDNAGTATATSHCELSVEQPSIPSSRNHRAASITSEVEEAPSTRPAEAPLQQQTPDVLLPHAQITTPSGFSVPELLQDRLLPREAPELQHKMSELYAVRDLIDTCDSTVCRFAVSFMWFVLLRCRKAHREQSLVDGFSRLSRALSNAFPHVSLDKALPPLDVLEQLLVELLTCSRHSAAMQKATNTASLATRAPSAATAACTSRCAQELQTPGRSSMLKRTSDGAASTSGRQASVSSASPLRSMTQKTSRTPNAVIIATTPSTMPLRLRLQDHNAYFPLLLSPPWSRLLSKNATDDSSSAGNQKSSPRRPQQQQHEPYSPHQREEKGVLPSDDALVILSKVYQDLWLQHSEYVQLCLYEELLYKQLAMQFGSFAVQLHQRCANAKASTASATTASFSATVRQALQPSVTWLSPAVAEPTSNTGADGGVDLRSTRSSVPTSRGGHLRSSKARNTTTTMATTPVTAAAAATPVVTDGILDSLLLLVAHATYYNCVFCFPNDVYAGLFDEDFRADVVRWLFFCSHGIVLTHVQVRRWPMPAKADYVEAQLKRKVAVERELSALGLLTTYEQQPIGTCHKAAAPGERGKSSHTVSANAAKSASLVVTAEDSTFDVGDVAANSEARLVYQLSRYDRSAALHVAELERCMARLQRRHMAGGLHGSCSSQHQLRCGSASGRTPRNSTQSSMGSVAAVPSLYHVHSNLSEMGESVAPSSHRAAARTQTEARKPTQQNHSSGAASRAMSLAVEAGSVPRIPTDEPLTRAAESLPLLPPVDALSSNSNRSGFKQSVATRHSTKLRLRRSRCTSALLTASLAHRDGEEEARAQYRTSVAAAAGQDLVALAAELSTNGHKGSTARAAQRTNSAQADRQESDHRASFNGSAAPRTGAAALPYNRNVERLAAGGRSHQWQSSSGSLLSSYPLCISPAPIRDYWLAMLLRAPLWWTTRTAMATAAAVADAGVVTSPAALQQQSSQLVLWSSAPISADGEAVPRQDLCRLQLEPWRGLFAIVVVPPISKDAQQAAHHLHVYGETLAQQQARLYGMAELQGLHHQQNRQWCSQEHSRVLPVLALTPASNVAEMPASPMGVAVSVPEAAEKDEPTVSVTAPCALCISGAERNGHSVEAAMEALRRSTAMLPVVPLGIPEDAAAVAGPTTTARLVTASTLTASHLRRHGVGETYQGRTSPFLKLYSSDAIPTSSGPSPGLMCRKGGDRVRWQAHRHQAHHSVAASRNGSPESTEVTELTVATTPFVSPLGTTTQDPIPQRPTGAHSHRYTPADQGLTVRSTAVATTRTAVVTKPSMQSSGGGPSIHVPSSGGHLRSRGGGGRSNGDTSDKKSTMYHQGNTFAITAIPREETTLRPRRLGPLKKEALHRRAQLLADMDTICKRDQVARQHYIVQHLHLSNAMTYTQSEAMMRRYRAQSRLALERLICDEVCDAAATHAVAERTKEFRL
ncbi:hypothetical protein NXY56_000814 [Leishmania guyanensis]|uniref:Uncharacterized protein n=1 Tax=Leishmania guyanensis TaxID=5670 RepID=A0A1E1IQ10_LEIGU|nr:hypothetical protein, conserved [Leishmania guyanensis]